MKRANVILIGMPGVGKSTLGVVLAKRMNLSFLDTDLLIQSHMGKTLQSIIDDDGIDAFLKIESTILSGIESTNTIISTGGSAVYSHEAMKHLSSIGWMVYLKIGFDELAERLGDDLDERGVVFLDQDITKFRDLYIERAPLYEKYAEITVEVDGLSIRKTAEIVSKLLEEKNPKKFSSVGK